MRKKVSGVLFCCLVLFIGCDADLNVMKILQEDYKHPRGLFNYNAQAETNNTDENYVAYDLQIVLEAVQKLNYSECGRDALTVLEAITRREHWALQMFDSSSKFPVGLLHGNFYQMGNFDECMTLKQPSTHPETAITGQYCLADITLKNQNNQRVARSFKKKSRHSFNSTIFWSICVPSSCKTEEVEIVIKEIFSMATVQKEVNVRLPVDKCHVKKTTPFSILEIVYGSVIGVFGVFTLLATAFHYYVLQKKKTERKSTLKEAVLCFSIIRNVGKFLTTTSSGLNLNCISGIKFLSMLFIVTGHTLLFLIGGPVKNTSFYEQESQNILNAIFVNSPLLVDTFLLVGGFLLCYLLLLELDKRNGRVNIIALYIARYIRLTPSYLVVIGLYCSFLFRLGDGPLWDSRIKMEQQRCKDSWWTNLLYVNNYVNTDQMCMFQSWYLAVDYHLFIIAAVLIVVLWKWDKMGKTVLGMVILISVAIPFAITFKDKLDPTLMVFAPEVLDVSQNFYFKTVYIKTHMRASSYFFGVLLGYILYKLQKQGTKLSKLVICLGWCLSAACGLISMFSIVIFYHPAHEYNAFEASVYAALHRVAWCISIGWIIIVCVTKSARLVNSFLCWKPFVPLSRLTYCAYLANGFIEVYSFATLRDGIYMSKFELTNKCLSHAILTFSFAFVLCIFFESPIHGIEKIILSKNGANQDKKTSNNNDEAMNNTSSSL